MRMLTTYQGKTAGGHLKTARVIQDDGMYVIVSDTLPGILDVDDENYLRTYCYNPDRNLIMPLSFNGLRKMLELKDIAQRKCDTA